MQVWLAEQVPQLKVPPQPSEAVPQEISSDAQMDGTQAAGFAEHELLVQVEPLAQVPQVSVLPQPSLAAPQVKPSEPQVLGVQLAPTNVLLVTCVEATNPPLAAGVPIIYTPHP